jgi:hypothetical protein
LRVEEGC